MATDSPVSDVRDRGPDAAPSLPADAGRERGVSPRAWALLALLFLAYILSLMDRMILTLLVTDIRADLGISDIQIGLLQGLAFVLLYSAMGLPIGRMVDRANRTHIVALGIALWSVATAMCGMASKFAQLFVARTAVGVGEATLSPASYSLIADSFPPSRLGLATGIFALGASAGSGLALVVGGSLVQWARLNGDVTLPFIGTLAPWQQVFMLLGPPGLVLALMFLLIGEPARKGDDKALPAWADIGAFLRDNRTWIALLFTAVAASAMVLYGSTAWIIAMFERSHGWDVSRAGAATGTANIVGATIGLICGGLASDRMRERSNAHRLLICAAALALCALFSLGYPLAPTGAGAAVLWGGVMMTAGVPIGVAGANLQEALPAKMRGVIAAIYFFFINMIGAGLGPVLVPLTAKSLGRPDVLGPALAIVMTTASTVAAILFLFAFRAQRRAFAPGGAVHA